MEEERSDRKRWNDFPDISERLLLSQEDFLKVTIFPVQTAEQRPHTDAPLFICILEKRGCKAAPKASAVDARLRETPVRMDMCQFRPAEYLCTGMKMSC